MPNGYKHLQTGRRNPDNMAQPGGMMNLTSSRRVNRRTGSLLIALAALLAGAPGAQAKPNFSGDWKLNTSKSEFGPMPPPNSRTDKIVHADPSLKVTTTQSTQAGDGTYELKYSTDGSETTNELRGAPIKSTAKWEDDILSITSKASFGGNDITLTDKWTLSTDGKVLTIGRHIVSPQGELDVKIVMEKQ
jgi:hypothetical protein